LRIAKGFFIFIQEKFSLQNPVDCRFHSREMTMKHAFL